VSKVKYTVKLLNFGNVSLLRRHTHSLLHLSLCKHARASQMTHSQSFWE